MNRHFPGTTRRNAVVFGCALLLASVFGLSSAENQDHIVIVRESQTLEQLVEQELQSSRFAKQIANYNGIDAISTVLPIGASLQIPKPYILEREFGRIAFVKGDVAHTQRDLAVNPPAKGAMFFPGDLFTTGTDGFLSLSFNSGTTVNLQPESSISVVDIKCVDEEVKCVIELSAEKGEVASEITPRPEGQPPVKFSVKTPFLSAAVRGTAFYVNVEEGADRIGVTRGLVAADSSGNSNELPKGKGLLAAANIAPEQVDLLPAPNLTVASDAIFSAEDFIRWSPINGADQYRVTIATDESLSQPVSVQQQQDTINQPQLSNVGQYYLSVAGVDNKKFVGLPTMAVFNYASIDEDSTIDLEIERSGELVDITLPDYDGSVELLISNSFDEDNISSRIVDDLSSGLSLRLDSTQDWVFKARKVFSNISVSTYSNQYLLEALK